MKAQLHETRPLQITEIDQKCFFEISVPIHWSCILARTCCRCVITSETKHRPSLARNLNYFLRRNLRGPTYILTSKTPPHDPSRERGGLNLFSVKGIPRGWPSSRSNYTRHNIAILSSSILFNNGLISLIFSLILTIFRRKTSSCWYFLSKIYFMVLVFNVTHQVTLLTGKSGRRRS